MTALGIALPVLNEEARLRRGVLGTLEFCDTHEIDVKLTIADNGSTDGTLRVAEELSRNHPNVEYLSVGQRGVGRALKRAWTQATTCVVGYMDVDLATDLKHLLQVRDLFESKAGDLVVTGSRLLPGSEVINRAPLREAASRGFNFLLRTALGAKFTDGMCGFKFLRKTTFDKLLGVGVDNDDWFFNTEILVKAQWLGVEIAEIPVRWVDDRNSRVRLLETASKYIQEIRRLQAQKRTFS